STNVGNHEYIAQCVQDVCFFFFFQAEDGIRYRNVTGVQTCALPIYGAVRPGRDSRVLPAGRATPLRRSGQPRPGGAECTLPDPRSEERRVGKECRTRRIADMYKRSTTEMAICRSTQHSRTQVCCHII